MNKIKKENNFAYIDGANLYKGIKSLGWRLDYKRFRIWLSEKYDVATAYLFIGLIPKHKEIYNFLQECGFILIFKEVVYDGDGRAKGNCDADLVLQAAKDFYEKKFESAIIVASDGDYASLITFLNGNKKIRAILSPGNEKKCSILLKRTNVKIVYLNDKKSTLQLIKKAPDADRTA